MILEKQTLKKEEVERIEELCDFYRTDRGEMEIFNLMLDCKMFQPISEKDVPVRNLALQKLTELGFNQEDKIRKVIHWMLDHPVLDIKRKTGESDGND